MTRYLAFWGSIASADVKGISSAISAWVGWPVRRRSGLAGEELTWEAEGVEVFAHPEAPDAPRPGFLFEGRVPAAGGPARLTELKTSLCARVAPASLDYQERDEHDQDVGALQTIG